MSSRQGGRSGYHAPARGQQRGFVEEVESEESSSRHGHVGPSSSRGVGVQLTARNLARVDNQPPVRGPLEQLDNASEQFMREIHKTNEEINELNHSILLLQQQVQLLQRRIDPVRMAIREASAMGMTLGHAELDELGMMAEQEVNMGELIQQKEERRQVLRNRLGVRERTIERALNRLNLVASHGGSGSNPDLPRYPAHAELSEDIEVDSEWVYEQGRLDGRRY